MTTPENSAATKGQMLPGIAGICLFMLVVASVGVMGAFHGPWQVGPAKFAVLSISSILVIGVFGLLRMRRWGWAIVLAGTLMLGLGYILMSHATKDARLLVMAGLAFCFFLYLVRPDVRDRML